MTRAVRPEDVRQGLIERPSFDLYFIKFVLKILQEFADSIVIANKMEGPLKTNSILCCFCFSLGNIWIRNLS